MTDVEDQHFVYQGELLLARQVLSKQGIEPVNV